MLLIEEFASEIPGTLGTGGMLSKIQAAQKVTSAGIPMIVARGDISDRSMPWQQAL